MAGIISPSMPVWVVENAAMWATRAFCNLNEGLGKVLRFGANSDDVLDRLRWLGGEFHIVLQTAVRAADHDLKLDGPGAAWRRTAQSERGGVRSAVQTPHPGTAGFRFTTGAVTCALVSSPATTISSSMCRWRPASR